MQEKMKAEAIKRMKALNLHENVIREFEQEDKLNYSDHGILYWLDNLEYHEEILAKVKECNGLPYHVIRTQSNIGLTYEVLYVCNTENEWEFDSEDLKTGYCFVYVFNKTMPDCSEFGSIGVQPLYGGVVRTA